MTVLRGGVRCPGGRRAGTRWTVACAVDVRCASVIAAVYRAAAVVYRRWYVRRSA